MKKTLFSLLILVLAIGLALPVAAHTEASPYIVDLIADGGSTETATDVGDVSVWNDGDKLYVRYETTGGWQITQTCLYVGKNVPPTSAPGQFPYNDDDATSVTDTVVTYEIPLDDVDSYSMQLNKKGKPTGVMLADGTPGVEPCNDIYIAAHAVAQIETMREIISAVTDYGFSGFDDTSGFSNTDGMVNLGASSLSLLGGFGQLSGYYGASLANLTHRGTRGLGVMYGETDEVDWRTIGSPESIEIVFDSAVYIDWIEVRSLFKKDSAPTTEEAEIGLYNDSYLIATMTLSAEDSLGVGNGEAVYDFANAPLADKLVYKVPDEYAGSGYVNEFAVAALEVFQLREETAWGNGTDFEQANWAMYFPYHIQPVPCMISSGNLYITGTGWMSVSAWCPCAYTYDLTAAGEPIALQGWVDLSEAAVANTNEWSKYYAIFYIRDSGGKEVSVVFCNDWLGPWYEMPAQQWDRIRMENNMGLPKPLQYYATVGGTLGYDMTGTWVGPGNGATVYPSNGNYFFQLIADPIAEAFTLQVYGMGSSAPANPPNAWPKQNMLDYPTWLEIGTIIATGFDFSQVNICAVLWASDLAGAAETTTIYWDGMVVDTPVPLSEIPV